MRAGARGGAPGPATQAPSVAVHERAIVVGRAGEIRGLSPELPAAHTLPTLSGPQLATPASLQYLADEYAVFWADTDVSVLLLAAAELYIDSIMSYM